jgi:hypothetical protein
MTDLSTGRPRGRLKIAAEALIERREDSQWEELIGSMLAKLELPPDKYSAAKQRYEELGRHVAKKLGVGDNDVHVVVQGSMRTNTTIHGDGREKFDLDAVVKLCGPRFEGFRESEQFFADFGKLLKGVPDAGDPSPKNRCWRLPFPGEPFYFDVTPAIPMSEEITGTELRVRDEEKTWSPSNPEDFAEWFCGIADQRFPFQKQRLAKAAMEARTTVDDLPVRRIRIDDILRRTVQLLKLHRDSYYKGLSDERKAAKPISVILVTLAAKAYDELVRNQPHRFSSSVEVVAEIVEMLPDFIDYENNEYSVDNPALRGSRENFAEKWNVGDGRRRTEFYAWHERLEADLEALFSEEYGKRSENRIRAVFGDFGVSAWKNSQASDVFAGLLGTVPAQARTNPTAPRNSGSKDKLA